MSREHLFRAKRLDNNAWVEGCLIKLGKYSYSDKDRLGITDKAIPVGFNGLVYNLEIAEVDPETVCEYTGLKDKNDNKIFEGDIIKTHHFKFNENNEYHHYEKNGVIELSDSYEFGYRLRWKKGHMMLRNTMQIRCKMDGEIIGNIFDNPELLETKE